MVKGLSNDRITLIHKMLKEKKTGARYTLYKKLKNDVFDEGEYRLSLWLPLTIKEKIDMMLHQRVEDEMEIMLFLLESEFDLNQNVSNNDRFEMMVERSLDVQIFDKYQNIARM